MSSLVAGMYLLLLFVQCVHWCLEVVSSYRDWVTVQRLSRAYPLEFRMSVLNVTWVDY